jgi:serine/threonine protein kinase
MRVTSLLLSFGTLGAQETILKISSTQAPASLGPTGSPISPTTYNNTNSTGQKDPDKTKRGSKASTASTEGTDLIGGYRKMRNLGSGVAGVVYEVEKGGKRFALKRTKDKGDMTLQEEYEILKSLSSEDGFPKPYDFFKCGGRDCLVMELVGPVVSRLQRELYKFPPETVGSLGIQLIDRIEVMHKHGLVHGDFYRNNMSPGRGSSKNKIFAIDFGQVKSKRPQKFDVKSVMCTLVALLNIQEHCSHFDDFRKDKEILRKSPGPVGEFINYVESLSSSSKIDYEKMRSFMRKLVESSGHSYKGEIIWPKELLSIIN